MLISDWSSDVCSSALRHSLRTASFHRTAAPANGAQDTPSHPSLHRGDPRMNATPTPAAVANADRHVSIFDTSLRDGEQSPGCSMTARQTLRFAQALSDLGVAVRSEERRVGKEWSSKR